MAQQLYDAPSFWDAMSPEDILALNQMPSVDIMTTPQGPTVATGGINTKELERMQLEAIDAEKRNLMAREALQRDAYANAMQSAQVDYTPLMTLVDLATGSNLAKNYKAPESVSAKQERLNASQDRIQRSREAISDDRMNLLRAKLAQQTSMTNAASNNAFREKLLSMRAQAADPLMKMPSEVKTKVGGLMTSLKSLSDMEDALKSGYGPQYVDATTPLIGKFKASNPYTIASQLLVDDIGRARSGGAINKDEEARFLSMLPTPADMKSPEVVQMKINTLRQEFADRLQAYGVNEGNVGKLGYEAPKYRMSAKAKAKGPSAPKDLKPAESMSDEELDAALAGGI